MYSVLVDQRVGKGVQPLQEEKFQTGMALIQVRASSAPDIGIFIVA